MILRSKEKIIYFTKICKVSTEKRDPYSLLKLCIYKSLLCSECQVRTYCGGMVKHRQDNYENHDNVIVFFNKIIV